MSESHVEVSEKKKRKRVNKREIYELKTREKLLIRFSG